MTINSPIFDATLLTRDEVTDVAHAIQALDDLSRYATILLGPIPVLGEFGEDVIGYLYQDDRDLLWRFSPELPADHGGLPPHRYRHPDHQSDFDPEDAA